MQQLVSLSVCPRVIRNGSRSGFKKTGTLPAAPLHSLLSIVHKADTIHYAAVRCRLLDKPNGWPNNVFLVLLKTQRVGWGEVGGGLYVYLFFFSSSSSKLPVPPSYLYVPFNSVIQCGTTLAAQRSLKISISPPVRLDIEKKLVFRLCCSTMAEFGRWLEPVRYCHRTLVREEPAARL